MRVSGADAAVDTRSIKGYNLTTFDMFEAVLNHVPGRAKIAQTVLMTVAAAGEAGALGWLWLRTPELWNVARGNEQLVILAGAVAVGLLGFKFVEGFVKQRPREEWVHGGLMGMTAVAAGVFTAVATNEFGSFALTSPGIVYHPVFQYGVGGGGLVIAADAGRRLVDRSVKRVRNEESDQREAERVFRRERAGLHARRLREREREVLLEAVRNKFGGGGRLSPEGEAAIGKLANIKSSDGVRYAEVLQTAQSAVHQSGQPLTPDLVVGIWDKVKKRDETEKRLAR